MSKDESTPKCGDGIFPMMQTASAERTVTIEGLKEIFEAMALQTDYKLGGPREFYISTGALLAASDDEFMYLTAIPGMKCLGGHAGLKAVIDRAKKLNVSEYITGHEQLGF